MGRKKKFKLTEVPMTEENTAVLDAPVEAQAETQVQPVSENVDEKYAMIEAANQELDQVRKDLERAKLEKEQLETEMKLSKVRRELDAQEIDVMNRQISRGNDAKAKQSTIDKQKAFDDVKVTGRFHNVRHPGSSAKLAYVKYSTDPAVWHTFEHGKVYTIPRGFSDQINEYYAKIQYANDPNKIINDPDQPVNSLSAVPIRHQLYSFTPVGF